MATNALTRYKSISRPRGEQSSAFSSTAKKLASAEDAIIDQQYSDGVISADVYKVELSKRLARTYLTPLQVVTIQDKINNVDTNLADAEIDNAYASGQIKTDQVLEYEKSKLSQMPATNSVAYQKQSQKVQQLTDKAEREKRTEFRISENLRIAQLPEDTSEKVYQKAQAYAELEQMARLDGDNQAADTFATQKINYEKSAQRAGINDLITNTRLSISGQPTTGLAVPSADRGRALYTGQPTDNSSPNPEQTAPSVDGSSVTGISGGQSSGGVVSTGGSGYSSPAMNNAFKSLDRSQNTIDRLYQEREQKAQMIATYQEAIGMAEGDQRTQLTIALNNLVDDVSRIDNSIATTSQGIEDTVVRIQEIQAKAAASQFSKELRIKTVEAQKAEDQLEQDFANGKLSKEEYIANGAEIANKKAELFNYASDGYGQQGNDTQAQSYLDKSLEMQDIAETLQGVQENIGDYESIQVDPGGKITNLFGQGLKPGDFSLTNVRRLKDSGVFDSNYVSVNGKYYRVYYPGQGTDNEGFPISSALSEDIAKLNNEAFVYLSKDGKVIKEPIAFIDSQDETGAKIVKPIIRGDLNVTPEGKFTENPEGATSVRGLEDAMKQGLYQVDEKGNIVRTQSKVSRLEQATMTAGNLENTVKQKIVEAKRAFENAGGFPKIGTMKKIDGVDVWFPFEGETNFGAVGEAGKVAADVAKTLAGIAFDISPAGGAVRSLKEIDKASNGFFSNAINSAKSIVGQAAESVKNFFIPKVEAQDISTDDDKFTQELIKKYSPFLDTIQKTFGSQWKEALYTLNGENGGANPTAINKNTNGSLDTGLFQINSDTFNDFARRKGNVLKQYGINSYDDMKDPNKNATMARIIHDEQGWNAWYGAPDWLRDRPKSKIAEPIGTKPIATPTPTVTRAATPTPTSTPAQNRSILDIFRGGQTAQAQEPTVIRAGQVPVAPKSTSTPSVIKANDRPIGPVYNGDANFNGQVDWNESKVGQAVNNIGQSVKNFFTAPSVASPVPSSTYKAPTQFQNVVQGVQKAVAPVVQQVKQTATPILQQAGQAISNFVGGAVNTAKNVLGKLKFW